MNALAEYRLETYAPRFVSIVKSESVDPFGAIRMAWGVLFEINVFPAITAGRKIEMLSQVMSEQV